MDAYWEPKLPIVLVRALERIEGLSDHVLILLTIGLPRPQSNHQFKFELVWLQREGFRDMVNNVWERPVGAGSPVQRSNKKL
jgi:hypothetical protein